MKTCHAVTHEHGNVLTAHHRVMLLRLPPELQVEVASHLKAAGLLALSGASRACRAATEHDSIWREMLQRQLQPILRALFDGNLPPPEVSGQRSL